MSGVHAPPQPSRVTWRFRLVVCCLLLVALAFCQRPGRIVSDTKFDLVADPGGMLSRALHMWDPTGGFGQVQNQAYGYFFPMGPFFWVGDLLSIPAWVVQRGWWSLLLVVAFLGVVRLCAALDLGSPTARVVAGLAYALSPRILTTLGPISIEAWPMALAPWVLVPLVLGCRTGSPRRAAALSALAVAAVGGVNAAATSAVLPLGAIWLLTRAPGPRRRALMTWWPALVAVGTLWWLVPLFLLGGYSPPFLDFIETASVTTFPTTPVDVLRGTSHWVPYVDSTWRAGNDLVSTGYVAINGAVLLVLGMVGLSLRSNPHRRFLVLGLLTGVVLVSLGHSGAVHGWLAAGERDLLDGALAPLRNVHKFEPVVRLPLVLALAHVLGEIGAAAAPRGTTVRERLADGQRVAGVGLLVLGTVAVAGVASPALAGRLAPAHDFAAVPGYWKRTVSWLEQQGADDPGRGTALLVPGSSFATYLWGMPEDEPVQSYGVEGWAVRNAVPLAPPGNIRMLDAVEDRLSAGLASPGLGPYLGRAGVGLLVVRNDLRPSDDVPLPVLVHQALEGSPGIEKVAEFGPDVGGPVRVEDDEDDNEDGADPVVAEDGWHASYPAVEVYRVSDVQGAIATDEPPVVVGGPESVLDLLDAGLLGDEPTVLAADAPDGPTGQLLLTDGLRRVETTFARVHDARSATLAADDDGRRGAPARDYVRAADEAWETTSRILGARSVEASGSRAYADSGGPVQPETLPYAAFDGRVETQWESGPPRGGRDPWLEVDLEEARGLTEVTVVSGDLGDTPSPTIRVETEAGVSPAVRAPAGDAVVVPVPEGLTSWIRISAAPAPGDARELAIAEVRVDGLDVDRTMVLPEVPAAWGAPDHVLLASGPAREACVRVAEDVRCASGRSRPDEDGGVIDRTVVLGEGAPYTVALGVRPVASDALTGLVLRDQLVNVSASTTAADDARGSAVAAIDGAPGTTWVAEEGDPDPTLTLSWIGERTVRGIRLAVDDQAPASRPTRVELVHPGGRQVVRLDRTGRADVTPFRTTNLEVHVLDARPTESRSADGTLTPLGVGVSEVRLDGVGLLPIELSDVPIDIGCGFGPTLRVGDGLFASSVVASRRQLFDGAELAARACGPETADLAAGSTRVVASPAPAFRPTTVTFSLPGATVASSASPAQVDTRSAVSATILVEDDGAAERVVGLTQNTNPGWTAALPGGARVDPVVVDGWRQGWQVPAGVSTIDVRYGPDTAYRVALGAGAMLLVALAVGAVLGGRRSPGRLPAVEGRVPAWTVPGAGLLALGLVWGWWGLGCGGLAVVVTVAARTRVPPPTVAWVAGLPLVAAGLVYWWRPLGSADGWAGALAAPQLLAALAVGALVAADIDVRRPRSRRRSAGRSTQR